MLRRWLLERDKQGQAIQIVASSSCQSGKLEWQGGWTITQLALALGSNEGARLVHVEIEEGEYENKVISKKVYDLRALIYEFDLVIPAEEDEEEEVINPHKFIEHAIKTDLAKGGREYRIVKGMGSTPVFDGWCDIVCKTCGGVRDSADHREYYLQRLREGLKVYEEDLRRDEYKKKEKSRKLKAAANRRAAEKEALRELQALQRRQRLLLESTHSYICVGYYDLTSYSYEETPL